MWKQVYALLDDIGDYDVIKSWKFDLDFVFPLVELTVWRHNLGLGYHETYTVGLY